MSPYSGFQPSWKFEKWELSKSGFHADWSLDAPLRSTRCECRRNDYSGRHEEAILVEVCRSCTWANGLGFYCTYFSQDIGKPLLKSPFKGIRKTCSLAFRESFVCRLKDSKTYLQIYSCVLFTHSLFLRIFFSTPATTLLSFLYCVTLPHAGSS